MLFDVWFVLGLYGSVVVIPLAVLGLLLLVAAPGFNREHPPVRRVLWALALTFSALSVSLAAYVELTVD